jgi:hypothetical protein
MGDGDSPEFSNDCAILFAMRTRLVAALGLALAWALAGEEKTPTAWPGSLRNGLPAEIPGYEAAPRDPLPDTDENDMGIFTEVSRFYQRIEGPTVTRQFRLVVQDYGKEKNLEPEIRKAVAESAKVGNVEAKETTIAGRKAFAVTDRSSGNPTTLVTVVVLPSRLVLAQGANVDRDAALKLLSYVDFAQVAAAK